MRRNVVVLLAVGLSLLSVNACKMHCADDCQKTRDEALQTCDGDACERAKTNYQACIKVCDGKHDDTKR
jgi:hypothetical protein